jgi:hypothetical protein
MAMAEYPFSLEGTVKGTDHDGAVEQIDNLLARAGNDTPIKPTGLSVDGVVIKNWLPFRKGEESTQR